MGCGASTDAPAAEPPAAKGRRGRGSKSKDDGFAAIMGDEGGPARRRRKGAKAADAGSQRSGTSSQLGKRKRAKKGIKKGKKKKRKDEGHAHDAADGQEATAKKKAAQKGSDGKHLNGHNHADAYSCPSPKEPVVRTDPAVRVFDFDMNPKDLLPQEKWNKMDRWLMARGDLDGPLLCPQVGPSTPTDERHRDLNCRDSGNGTGSEPRSAPASQSDSLSMHLRKVSVMELNALIPQNEGAEPHTTRSEVNVDAHEVREEFGVSGENGKPPAAPTPPA